MISKCLLSHLKVHIYYLFSYPIIIIVLLSGYVDALTPSKEKELDLDNINLLIKREYSSLKEADDKAEGLLNRLNYLNMLIKEKEKELNIYKQNVDIQSKKKVLMEQRLLELDKSIEDKKVFIEKRVQFLYKYGSLPYIKVLSYLSDFSDFLMAHKIISNILKHDEIVLNELKKEKAEQEALKREVMLTMNDIMLYKDKTLSKQEELKTEVNKKKTLLYDINGKKTMHVKVIEELKERAERLKALIEDLRQKRGEANTGLTDFENQKGLLIWPTKGKVVSSFGIRRHPKFNTYIFNNGLDIEVLLGSDIKSIYQGEVALIEDITGYGNIIILDHGKGYYSLYAHAEDILVKVGDAVKQGQTIASVGLSDPFKEKASLYFEIRHKGKPYDPLIWLRRE